MQSHAARPALAVVVFAALSLSIPSAAGAGPETATRLDSVRTFLDIASGTPTRLTLLDGSVHAGVILGTTLLSDSEYAVRYADARNVENRGSTWPAMGESVTVVPLYSAEITGAFAGFGVGDVLVQV